MCLKNSEKIAEKFWSVSKSLLEYTRFKLGYKATNNKKLPYPWSRYSKASNNCLKSYDPQRESKYIIYLDANNLYGYAMSKFVPTSGFKWIDS